MTADFKDHFPTESDGYAQYRPSYPDELYRYLASLISQHESAWDCATGSGQAATAFTKYYKNVIASDASESQIAIAQPHSQVEYRVVTAEYGP